MLGHGRSVAAAAHWLVRRFVRAARWLVRRLLRATRSAWYAHWRARPVQESLVLFESFGGHGAACNPEALFRAVHRAADLQHLTSVWALDRRSAVTVRAEFRDDPRVRVVTVGGFAYWHALAVAGTLVNNATFPPAFDRRPAQRYLNTWHGTPLKRMGFDEPDGASVSANVVRNLLQATWLLSQSPWMTDVLYRRAYRLEGIAAARVLEVGYPRDDRLSVTVPERSAIRSRLRAAGVRGDEQIVLWAPTWRGARFSAPEDHSAEIARTAEAVQRAVAEAGSSARVLVQPHQAVRAFADAQPALDGRLVPADVPVNAVLAVTSVLVTDWSSIAVDFLATGRPIAFAALDDGAYERQRGLSVDPADLPGRRCRDEDALAAEVVRALRDGVAPDDVDRYRRAAARLVPADDGGASGRVLDVVFRGAPGGAVLTPIRRRPSVLVHLGGMRANGITSAARNVLPALVDAGLDVTVFTPRSGTRTARALRAGIDPRVRHLQRVGGIVAPRRAVLRQRLADRRADATAHRAVPALARMWDEEWHRCFGDARFDAVVDFSGYSPLWATILLHAPGDPVRSIWMHNDMAAETERLVDGRPRMRRSLRAVIARYPQFDRVVAVSPALRDENLRSLPGLGDVRVARNLVDDLAVLRGAAADPEAVLRDAAPPQDAAWVRPAWLDSFRSGDACWFVSVGRLSPEKNHTRLLAAFAVVHGEHPRSRLLVVGDGWLRRQLEREADRLGVAGAVVFAGAVPNPFPFMAGAACVVVSSDHEGQPMVVLEAAVLGRPVVSTRFAAAADALPGGTLHLVDTSVPALADGLRAVLAGAVAPSRLDVAGYTATVTAEFLAATLPDDLAGPLVDAVRDGARGPGAAR